MESKNTYIYSQDKKEMEEEILHFKEPINIFCSFTYITPNYNILFTLNELKKFTESGNYNVIFVVWDMNVLANRYFKRKYSSQRVFNSDEFIDERIKELRSLSIAMGFDKEKLSIYKSSDLWKRLIHYKDQNMFQEFYTVISKIHPQDFVESRKVSHLFQKPIDIFFCNYLHKLCPEDIDKPIDVVFIGEDRKKLYTATRDLMVSEGIIETKSPLMVFYKAYKYLLYEGCLPEWNMTKKDIGKIILNCQLTKEDMLILFDYILNGIIEIPIEENIKNKSTSDLRELLTDSMYKYLKGHYKKFLEMSDYVEETISSINSKEDIKKISKFLKSDIALDILLKSDGSKNTTQISREMNKSIATISTYTNSLKKAGLIRVLQNGNLKRNLKGVKINFEVGV